MHPQLFVRPEKFVAIEMDHMFRRISEALLHKASPLSW